MERYRERDLEILTAIEEGRHLTQRALAQRLGVALGLTNDYMSYSLGIYRRTRDTLREALGHLNGQGLKRIAFYHTGEAAELAYVTLKEFGLEPVAVFEREESGSFLGL